MSDDKHSDHFIFESLLVKSSTYRHLLCSLTDDLDSGHTVFNNSFSVSKINKSSTPNKASRKLQSVVRKERN